jgi:D-glycero-D-manno-heptose 1,7-bisphosphate phosphatase
VSRLVILDRDGVINHDASDYIKSPDEWHPIPGSLEAIARLNQHHYRVVIATNQSGVARGLYSLETLGHIHAKMHHLLAEAGGSIDAIFVCPHGPDEGCRCRKPQPGMLEDIAERLQCDLSGVPFVGDSLRDLQAALAVGALPVLVRTGNGLTTERELEHLPAIPIFNDLAHFTDTLLQHGLPD